MDNGEGRKLVTHLDEKYIHPSTLQPRTAHFILILIYLYIFSLYSVIQPFILSSHSTGYRTHSILSSSSSLYSPLYSLSPSIIARRRRVSSISFSLRPFHSFISFHSLFFYLNSHSFSLFANSQSHPFLEQKNSDAQSKKWTIL